MEPFPWHEGNSPHAAASRMDHVRTLKQYDIPPKKDCSDCKEKLDIYHFNVAYTMKSGTKVYATTCKTCTSRQRKDLAHIRRIVGAAPPIGTPCWACKEVPRDNKRLCCDHDHKTGRFRGWLCGKCNRSIGLMNESKENCIRIYEYLCNAEDIDGRAAPTLSDPGQSRLWSFVDGGSEARHSSDEGTSTTVSA